jgi:hypothetical protein
LVRYLTKSRFKVAVECPRKLYYTGKSEIYQDAKHEDTFLQSLADGGFQVGELAKRLYSEGVEVIAKSNEEALNKTAELMVHENVTLFEPAIAHGNFLVRIDVLVKTGTSIKLVEVKAKSIRSDDYPIEGRDGLKSAFRPYIEDIAFQSFVVRSAFPSSLVTSYLLMPDKCRIATVDEMNQLFKIERCGKQTKVVTDPRANALTPDQSLLHEFNVDGYIDKVHERGLKFPYGTGSMADTAAFWAEAYAEDRPLPPPIGAHCTNCEFRAEAGSPLKSGFHECWKEANNWTDADFAEPTLLDLWNFRGKQQLIDKGVRRLSEVTKDDLKYTPSDRGLSPSGRQWLQVGGLPIEFKSAGFYLDHGFMAEEMKGWRYPLHFIDFETSTVALPFHIGMRPYESVAFQFSHHIMEQDGSLRHANQFLLSEAGHFPNYEFARELKAALSNDVGSVFMWANHENTILTHIIQQLETRHDAPDDNVELATFLKTLTKGGDRAMIDLRIMAQKGYFHPSTKGSCSIKKVLPAVLESSTFLRERYSQPIYGASDGIPSLNFRNMAWWSQNKLGRVHDPYNKLKHEAVTGQASDEIDSEDLDIAGGGEASMAYGRLQFETITAETKKSIEDKLLRYCELDTLAMAMIVEAWKSHTNFDE